MYVHVYASMPFAYYKYVNFSLYMSSRRGSVAHTGTYDGADGCSNPNYHKGILFQNRFPFARKIYLKDFRKESEGPIFLLELDPPPINAYIHIQTDMYKYMHIYCIYMHMHTIHTNIDMHIHTIHTNMDPIPAYTHLYMHIHAYLYTYIPGPSHGIKCIKRYVHVYTCMCMYIHI